MSFSLHLTSATQRRWLQLKSSIILKTSSTAAWTKNASEARQDAVSCSYSHSYNCLCTNTPPPAQFWPPPHSTAAQHLARCACSLWIECGLAFLHHDSFTVLTLRPDQSWHHNLICVYSVSLLMVPKVWRIQLNHSWIIMSAYCGDCFYQCNAMAHYTYTVTVRLLLHPAAGLQHDMPEMIADLVRSTGGSGECLRYLQI